VHALVEALQGLERWEALLSLLDELRRHLPEDAVLVCAQARALLAREAEHEAVALLRQVVAQRPQDAAALSLLGEALARIGDQAAAIAAYEQALAADPHRQGVASALEEARRTLLWHQGEEALQQARWDAAARAFRHLQHRSPDDPRALQRLELLASLEPRHWTGTMQAGASSGPVLDQPALDQPHSQRLAEFAAILDRLQNRIEAHIDPLS
jgi:tetratricopeptide (TPR) repeat protein